MKFLTLAAALSLSLSMFSAAHADAKLGTPRNPLKFAFIPSSDSAKMMSSAEPLQKCLEEKTGYYYDISIPPSYVVVIEGFGSGKVDLSVFTSTSYAKAVQKGYGVEPLLKVIRKGSASYRGQFVTRANSSINKLEDLNGKRVAFVDPASGSGYLLPKKMLNNKGIKPSEETFANKHDVVITMLCQKNQNQIDAGATFYNEPTTKDGKHCEKADNKKCFANDARSRVLTQCPDVFSTVKVIALTDELPNDPITIRKDLPAEMKTKIKAGMKTCLADLAAQKRAINDIDGAVDTSPAEYAPLISLFKELKVDLDKALAPKK